MSSNSCAPITCFFVSLAEAEVVRGRRVAYSPMGRGRAAEVVLPPEIIKLMKGVYQRRQRQRRTDWTRDDRTNLVLGEEEAPQNYHFKLIAP